VSKLPKLQKLDLKNFTKINFQNTENFMFSIILRKFLKKQGEGDDILLQNFYE